MDYIRRAYFIYTGRDIRRLPDAIQQAFALLPPDPEFSDFFGSYTAEQIGGIMGRMAFFRLAEGHDYTTDCEANRLIEQVVAGLGDDSNGTIAVGPHMEREMYTRKVN